MRLRRKWSKSKNVWVSFKEQFECHGWDYIPVVKKFVERFVLKPKLVKFIFSHPKFSNIFPQTKILSQFDFFLALLYKCNMGCEWDTLSDIFGAHPNSHSSNFAKFLDAAIFFFRDCIKFPSKETCLRTKHILDKRDYPNPENVFLGDAIDSPIYTSNQNYYTPKQSCPSKHAIRVHFIYNIAFLYLV